MTPRTCYVLDVAFTPPLRAGAPTITFPIRLTLAERAHIKALADADGLTMGEYLRRLVPGLVKPKDEVVPTSAK